MSDLRPIYRFAPVSFWLAVAVAFGGEEPGATGSRHGAGRTGSTARRRATYDRLDAGRDAYRYAEQQRREALGQQLSTKEQTAWDSGLPTPYYSYGPGFNFAYRQGISVYSGPRTYRGPMQAPVVWQYLYPAASINRGRTVPGNIFGYPYAERAAADR